MSEAYKKLIKTLRTLFEMDKADLDFGIYRILNRKRDEIDRFLEHDLLPQVKEAFADYAGGGKAELQAELEQAIEQAKQFGAPDPEQAPPVLAIKARLASAVDITAVENEVYSHLHTFFSRYYDQGDFISQRRYKADTYAIPYEGEEVKLYWANHDQYYVKSSEHLRDYAFTVHDDDGRTVRIKLVEADTEKDNVKAAADQERRFVLDSAQPLHLEDDELQIRFKYVPAGKKKQDALNADAVTTIFSQKGYDDWLNLLRKPAPTEANPKRTLLEKHLNDYTARNTFDYFIHKDLGGFLRRELDFYIKSEVLHLDDVDDAAFAVTEVHLRKIKVLRSVAHKIIRMLSQIEDFQKKLWLKKKFVAAAHYCITLDLLPDALYGAIASNLHQWERWRSLSVWSGAKKGSIKDLKANPSLMIDTALFDRQFKDDLLASIDNLDEALDGVLIQGDNMQALGLLTQTYSQGVKCIYIDPPYNAKTSEILYKNAYKHSSWVSLMHGRTILARSLLKPDSLFIVAIDENEQERLGLLLNALFPDYDRTCVSVVHNPRGIQGAGFSYTNEFAYFVHRTGLRLGTRALDVDKSKPLMKTGSESTRDTAKNCFYPIFVRGDEVIGFGDVPHESFHPDQSVLKRANGIMECWPISTTDGLERKWRYARQSVDSIKDKLEVRTGRGKVPVIYLAKDREAYRTVWTDAKYNAAEYGSTLLRNIIDNAEFSFPKSLYTVSDSLSAANVKSTGDIVLDYFAGSGTTAHAVIDLNRDDGLKRKYILVEAAEYFDTVLRPRIEKVVFSREWKSGKPESYNTGVSHAFKYMRIESYEDSLNNLVVCDRSSRQQDMLDNNPALREDYMLGYWLNMETADSASLLSVDQFEDPFEYKLNIATGSVGAFKPAVVDLVETFNYLIGLCVKHMDTIRGFKVVTGTNPQGEAVLVIWRKVKEKDNAALEAFMNTMKYNPRDTDFARIYVNGDHTLEDPHSKVKMTEIEFKRLMFDVQDV